MGAHTPVLLKEAVQSLEIKPEGVYVDMTFGRGGHTKQIIRNLSYGTIVAFDLDDEAIEQGKNLIDLPGIALYLRKSNFADIKNQLELLKIRGVDGVLLDLGVSSPQFDDPNRGFSYRYDTELDMRMDQSQRLTAKEVVNGYEFNNLYRIFTNYGEEKFAKQIARAIEKQRLIAPIRTTGELVDLVKSVLPKKVLLKDKHPAKQVFQALRIEVNGELDNLKKALEDSLMALNPGGVMAIITYHSLEDRIVKQFIKMHTVIVGDRLNFPTNRQQNRLEFENLYRKPILPSPAELQDNPRSHSAKLRAIKRL